MTPISGTTLSATRTACPASLQQGGRLVPGVHVARDHDRPAQGGGGEPRGVVQQHFRVAAVGTTDQEDEVGLGPLDSRGPRRRRACRTRRGRPWRRRSARRGIPPRRSPAARTPPPRAAALRPRSSRPAVSRRRGHRAGRRAGGSRRGRRCRGSSASPPSRERCRPHRAGPPWCTSSRRRGRAGRTPSSRRTGSRYASGEPLVVDDQPLGVDGEHERPVERVAVPPAGETVLVARRSYVWSTRVTPRAGTSTQATPDVAGSPTARCARRRIGKVLVSGVAAMSTSTQPSRSGR